MFKILTIIGARPQIIKSAAISRAIRLHFSHLIEEKILHTGQHYDANMSQVFFDELGIPKPDYNLGVGSAPHGEQTAKMIVGIEQTLQEEKFDGVILFGDTNSTLAGAIAASKLHVPIFHIEAGLRSFNMAMPEEINRIVCDQLSSILFCPTQTGLINLQQEGITKIETHFQNGKRRIVLNSGDIMFDNSKYFGEIAENKISVSEKWGLESGNYILSTIHRNNNTDDPKRLSDIFQALLDLSETNHIQTVLPLHPRTAKLLDTNLRPEIASRLKHSPFIVMIPPASFFEIIALEKHAKIVMTDSGGVQKEAFFFERPCIILRPETEWIEIVQQGAGMIADANYDQIMKAYQQLITKKVTFPQLFGDGHAAEFILKEIVSYLS